MHKTEFDFAVIDDGRLHQNKRVIEVVFPIGKKPKDLMIKGGRLYCVWCASSGLWIENDDGSAMSYIVDILDTELKKYAEKYESIGVSVKVRWMWDPNSHAMDDFIKFIEKYNPPNLFKQLNQKIVPADAVTKREDYISMKLPYTISPGECPAYDRIMAINWDPSQALKLEWFLGGVLIGAMKHIQKFLVLHGDPGSGKSTWINLIQAMLTVSKDPDPFKGYWIASNFKKMGEANNDFSLESFRTFPLVAIQHDGDLSKIEDNTLINQIVSHETVELNEKNTKKYPARIYALLIMGTNKHVMITERRSGITRRLVDAKPSGRKIDPDEFERLIEQTKYEYGQIAYKCIQVFKKLGPHHYDRYVAHDMLVATNPFYDFMITKYDEYVKRDKATQSEVWLAWKQYCEYAGIKNPQLTPMSAELSAYFKNYQERGTLDGVRVRKLYSGFRKELFQRKEDENDEKGESKKDDQQGVGICNSTGNDMFKCSVACNSDQDTGRQTSNDGRTGDVIHGLNEWLIFKQQPSLFDQQYADYPAQYETEYRGNLQPEKRWGNVTTKLKDLDTSKTHYVLGPSSLIFMDFDKKNANGEKDFELNRKAAESFKPTYAELSKSGGGIHLYYIYTGDVSKLANKIGDDIEIKVCPDGKKSAIRRMLTQCNDIPIATISSGLPLKGEKRKVVNWDGIKDEQHLRNIVNQSLRRESSLGSHTSENIQAIRNALENAYSSGMHYDISDLKLAVLTMAGESTNQKDICIAMVDSMHFKSDDEAPPGDESQAKDDRPIVLDIEVYRPDPETGNEGLFLVCWKYIDAPPETIVDLINPEPWVIEDILRYKIIGYNIREYDAPMLIGRTMGDGNLRSYDRSNRIINLNDASAKPRGSQNAAWMDIYEIMKASGEGMSLKKFETNMVALSNKSDEELAKMKLTENQMKAVNIFRNIAGHEEMNIPWDKPAPKELWDDIIKYCHNDVLATEAAYWYYQSYVYARLVQVAVVKALHPGISAEIIDTANTLSKKIMFGDIKNPQSEFNYRDLSQPVSPDRYEEYREKFGPDYEFRVWDANGLPVGMAYVPGDKLPDGYSILPFFPGYTFNQFGKKGFKSFFMDDYGGEGGRTYSEEGMWVNVWDGDISSQYPTSVIFEVLFGPRITKIYKELVQARIAVKHKDFETAGKLLNGALKPYLREETAKDLAQALKIIINAVYGLTTASFPNEFKDEKNIDNIVAKRGNLFMLVLKKQVEKQGYKVCHIKTDSIKIPDADQYIQDFVIQFGKEYGYNFETEGYFDKFVLLNDAAYVAHDKNTGEWVTKAKQFQEPFVRKTLFTKEPVLFDDLVQSFSVSSGSALYLDMNENLPDVKDLEKEATKIKNALSSGKIPKTWNIKDPKELEARLKQLKEIDIPAGHKYQFIGRFGNFLPIKEGKGGGKLYRIKDDIIAAASGTTGYRWLPSESVRLFMKNEGNDIIDMSYYTKLADQAVADISKYGDFDWFVNGEVPEVTKKEGPLISVDVVPAEDFMNIPVGIEEEWLPFR